MSSQARVLVFTGDGKGKTTAALGMALRASGHDMPALVIQFCKANAATGEVAAVRRLGNVEIVQVGLGWVPESSDPAFARHREAAERGLERAAGAIASGRYRLVVLDEVCYAVARGLLTEDRVAEAVRAAKPDSCVVLTGRGATAGLMALADTVTEMKCVKHGLTAGRKAQEGVEL